MKNRFLKLSAILVLSALINTSCTDNQRARNFGGTETIELLPDEEFVNITWKQDNIWIVVKNKKTGVFYAREKSSFGVIQGKIIIK